MLQRKIGYRRCALVAFALFSPQVFWLWHTSSKVKCSTPAQPSGSGARAALVSFSISYESSTNFYYHELVYVSELAPWVGPVLGGTRVNVLGVKFKDSHRWLCRYGRGAIGTWYGSYAAVSYTHLTLPTILLV